MSQPAGIAGAAAVPTGAASELWRLLARALQPPAVDPGFLEAMRELLAADIEATAAEIGLEGCTDMTRRFREQIGRIESPTQLLAVYSRLFLAPPVPAALNLGRHLEGVPPADCAQAIARLMAWHGVVQSKAIHDTPDLLPTVLEYLALRIAQQQDQGTQDPAAEWADVQELRRKYLLPASRRIASSLRAAEAEFGLPSLYSALLEIAVTALEDRDDRIFPQGGGAEVGAPAGAPRPARADNTVACRSCGQPIASVRDLAVILARLGDAGLPADHLSLCPACRGGCARKDRVPGNRLPLQRG